MTTYTCDRCKAKATAAKLPKSWGEVDTPVNGPMDIEHLCGACLVSFARWRRGEEPQPTPEPKAKAKR